MARTADMVVSSKILWNSIISTKDARFSGANIKNMYLTFSLWNKSCGTNTSRLITNYFMP
jgi:hypothetical protein